MQLLLTDTGWDKLDYWNSTSWEVIEEKLEDLKAANIPFNPKREDIFRALQLTPLDKVKVVILGQDPYPSPSHATGVAFSIPAGIKPYPPTLRNILEEYSSDLSLQYPTTSGNLESWCDQGVLLWNVIPTCTSYKSLSHQHWSDWWPLTEEIIRKCSERYAVFILMGRRAESFRKYIDEEKSEVIVTPHPSPLAKGFRGSRIFSTANIRLAELSVSPVDWRLEGCYPQATSPPVSESSSKPVLKPTQELSSPKPSSSMAKPVSSSAENVSS